MLSKHARTTSESNTTVKNDGVPTWLTYEQKLFLHDAAPDTDKLVDFLIISAFSFDHFTTFGLRFAS